MNKSTIKLIFAAAVLAAPTAVMAQPTQQARCTTDSLTIEQAALRIEWARKCGLTLNTGATPGTGNPNNWFNSSFFDTSFNPAKEYQENDPNRAYSGNSNTFYVNYWYTWGLFPATPVYTVFQQTSGPTLNFWKWSRPTQRPRPLYPSFDTTVTGTGTQLFPHPTLANCSLYSDKTGTTLWNTFFYVSYYCESSCYAPDQSLRFSDGDVNVVKAMKEKRDDLVTLTADATLDDLATQTARVFSYTTEIRDAENVIYKLTTASGGSLSVTNEHPIITSVGRLVQAQKLALGDELLQADGTPDEIIKIEKSTLFGKVYNIKPAQTEPVANILIAQGFLVGSARFQNDDIGYINRILLFRGVPDDVMPR